VGAVGVQCAEDRKGRRDGGREVEFVGPSGAGIPLWAVGVSGPLSGQLVNFVPGRASPRARVAAQARARLTGRASPGPVGSGPSRVWAGPNWSCFGRANGLRAVWTSIP